MSEKDYSAWHRFQVEETIKHYLFDQSGDEKLVGSVRWEVREIMEDLDKRGPRFFTLLFYRLARYGLDKMQLHPTPPEKGFMEIVEGFRKEWDENPELRESFVLGELP